MTASTATRVLCVDDNRDAASSLAELLELVGFDVRVSYGGAEGLTTARNFHPHACVLDLRMPGMDGYELARRVRTELGTDVLLVAVTGEQWDDLGRRTAEAGFDHVFKKPVDPEALLATLAAAQERFPT
jgi:CheY-like chemotaxis protein